MSSFHLVFSLLRVTYRSFPSPYPVSVSYSVMFRASSNLPRLFEAFVCRVRLTDWPSARRRERTSNSSVPNVSEYSRTLSNAIRPTIARAHLSRAPSSQNFWQSLCTDTFYVADIFLWITRTIIFKSYLFFSVDIPFFRGICPSIFNATISRKE